MNVLAALRRRHKRWIPAMAAAFAVAWLGMLWQPCAMAMGMDAHAGHGQQHSCPHCPPPQHADCEDSTEDCATAADRFDVDRRAAKLKFGSGADDGQHMVPPSCPSSGLPRPPFLRVGPAVNGTAPPGPPINVLFCTYLN